jgi:hypothetical protein
MTTNTFLQSIESSYAKQELGISFYNRFMAWCGTQQKDRLLWQSIILSVHGCVITPIVLMLSLLAGVEHYLYIPVIVAMAINLIPNLAALPTKITIPVFLLSVLIDILVIAAAVVLGMDISSAF